MAPALAAPARADVDNDFANQVHASRIYGAHDYNAWLAKTARGRPAPGLTDVAAGAMITSG
jgi:hypothetical protein